MGPPMRDGRINAHWASETPNDAWASAPPASLVAIRFDGLRPGPEDMSELLSYDFPRETLDGRTVLMLSRDKRSMLVLVQRP